MSTLSELQKERQAKTDRLLKACHCFFAFSNEQFQENKTELKEGEKYVSIGAGGYMPKSSVQSFITGMDGIAAWYNEEIKKNRQQEKEIIYELYNREAFYTGDLSDIFSLFDGVYTQEQIKKAFDKERKRIYKEERAKK